MLIQDEISYLNSVGFSVDAETIRQNSEKTVVVGMSGGVDSSVVAAVVKMLGFKTIGIFMKNWEEIDEDGVCSAELDFSDVACVCEQLMIPYYNLNFSKEYEENVFKEFLSEYRAGHTPNPDILCNREIKFKVFFQKAKELGADFLATGHYCQKQFLDGEYVLKKGQDSKKDQSYFLYTMKSEVLADVLFPIGHIEKTVVRQIAKDLDLSTQKKKDSTGICFIGERNFKDFLANYIEKQKGYFKNLETGETLIEHDGMCFYTLGQRKGLGIGGPGGPWFVAKKDLESNTVFVVEGEFHPALYADELTASEISWVSKTPPSFPLECSAKIRYRQGDQKCLVEKVGDKLQVTFKEAQRAISVRQSIVFYLGDICLGGAIISAAGQTHFEKQTTNT